MPVEYITNGGQDGSLIGRKPSDKIGFYGANPLGQQGNSNQHLIQRNMGGQLILFSSSLADTDTILEPQTTATLSLLTVSGLTPNDILLGISKIGYRFPYGYSGARINGVDSVEVTFTNPSTTSQQLDFVDTVWSGIVLRGILPYGVTLIREDLNPHTTTEQIVISRALEQRHRPSLT